MEIKCIDKYEEKMMLDQGYINRIDFADDRIVRLLENTKNIDDIEIKDLLNKINNQNVEEIDVKRYQYKHRGQWLGFSKLSKAERVFLVAYLADKSHNTVYFHTDITQLTKRTLKLFIKTFYKSSYINIVYDSKLSDAFYKAMIKEATA